MIPPHGPKPRMSVEELLVKARDLLVSKDWCQGVAARDAEGHSVEVDDDKACSFCLLGALVREAPDRDPIVALARDALRSVALPTDGLVSWNDTPGRTKAEVIDLFNKAIEEA